MKGVRFALSALFNLENIMWAKYMNFLESKVFTEDNFTSMFYWFMKNYYVILSLVLLFDLITLIII